MLATNLACLNWGMFIRLVVFLVLVQVDSMPTPATVAACRLFTCRSRPTVFCRAFIRFAASGQ